MARSASTARSPRHRSLGRLARDGAREVAKPAAAAAPRSRRQGEAPQDRALYTCSCGCAFNAAVSTSVGCPHCGRTQAW